ncbi:hypothetical protein F4808DRAFT_212387 [Astrocystis sublimbata]|nr:hypothetical protein F4808DRAFT_212387 [Astrocystis sublimbata]
MPTSLESSRPIMAPSFASPRASLRLSTYSTTAPSLAATMNTTGTNDSAHAEIRNIETGLQRMENKALSKQRVVLSEEKTANLSKLALGAKLDRALDRRMTGQDAVMRARSPGSKSPSPKSSSRERSSEKGISEKEKEEL